MSKGLESLNRIKKVNYYEDDDEIIEDCYGIDKDLCIIEKELKALEIIKNIGILKPYETSNGQCWLEAMCDATKITKDNFGLLKEVLL